MLMGTVRKHKTCQTCHNQDPAGWLSYVRFAFSSSLSSELNAARRRLGIPSTGHTTNPWSLHALLFTGAGI
ncbi:hypothetical protein I79_014963 [Cricetulus griseus]|uniref:Uncharacterized protein n=1 Tax=Cricetulus griseus TaxID=10029 RepID=G3HVH5_CRIGR|nr:hypothetical protein I79_014963 [Cricetulus griseus]